MDTTRLSIVPARFDSVRWTRLGGLVAIGLAFVAARAPAATVTLTASDAGSVYSFNTSANWSNSQAPSAGNQYFTGAYTLQANSSPFLGNSLQIDGGGRLVVAADIRVPNLTLDGGTLATSGARKVLASGSQITLTADSVFDATGGTLTIQNPIYGAGGLTIRGTVSVSSWTAAYSAYDERWKYEGDTTIDNGGSLTFSCHYPPGDIGKGDFIVNSGGSLTLSRATPSINGLYGGGTVSGVAFVIGNGNAAGDFSGTVTNAGTTKVGSGTQVFSAANALGASNPLTISGGTVRLDYTAQDNSKLSDTQVLTLGTGTLDLTGGSHVEVVSGTTLTASTGSRVTRGSGAAALRMNAITRTAGSAVNFGAASIADTDTTNANGILGGWATVGGQDWAVNSANGADGAIVALTSYDGPLPAAGGASAANYTLAGSLVVTGGITANTVKLSNTANGDLLDLGSRDLTITSTSATSLGGILYVGGQDGQYMISGTGRILPSTANQELLFNVNAGTLTVAAPIAAASASSPMTKTGPGRMVLGTASSYTGTTAVVGGTLAYGANDALCTGAVAINGGTLALGTFSDSVGAVTLTAGSIAGADTSAGTLTSTSGFTMNNFSDTTVTAILAGSTASIGLTKTGSGILTLSRPATYSGTTTISNGILRYGCNDALAAGAVTISGGREQAVLDIGSYSDSVGAVTVTSGDITGTGTLTATGFTLNGNVWSAIGNPYVGGVVFSTIEANLAGAGATLAKSKAGVYTLSGTNTYSGETTIAGGVLRADDGVGLPAGSLLTLSGNDLGEASKYAVLETASNVARTGGSAAGNMRITGGPSGFSAHGSPVRVAFGTLANPSQLTWGTAPFQPSNFVLNSIYATDTIEFTNPVDLNGGVRTVIVETEVATMSAVLSGSGTSGLTKGLATTAQFDTGTLVLTAANTYAGATTVNYGALNVRHATALGTADGGTTVASGAALEIQGGITVGAEALSLNGTGINATGALRNVSGTNEWRGAITLAGATRINSDGGGLTLSHAAAITGTNLGLTLGGSASGTVSGVIATGSGTLTKDGTGTWTLGGANTYTGTTSVTGGVLRAANGGGLPTSSLLTLNGGVLETDVDFTRTWGTAAGNVNLTGGRSGFTARGGAAVITLGSVGAPQSVTWGTNFNPSTFVLNLPTADSAIEFVSPINLNAAARTVEVAANTATISGALTGTGASGLTKTGVGRLVLTAGNGYAGATTIDAGTLEIAPTGTLSGTSGITINASGRLRYDSLTALGRSVTLSGGGLFYNSDLAFSGGLTFTSGTVGGTNLTGGLGNLTIGAARTLSPGNSPGTALTTSQTWDGSGTYLFEINSASGTAGTGWDLVSGSGNLVILAGNALPFTVRLASLTAANAAGNVPDFVGSGNYAWLMADFANPIGTFDATSFAIDTTLFTNPFSGQFSVARGDTVFGGDDTQLYVVYAVPEPASVVPAGLGLAALVGGLVRRQAGRASGRRR